MNDSTHRPICLTSIIKNEQRLNKSLFVTTGIKQKPIDQSDWKQLHLEELRKHTDELQKLFQCHQESIKHLEEVEARIRRDTKFSTLKEIVIAIALLVIAIAIWNHQRYVPLHNGAYIDSRTGECYTPGGVKIGK